MKRPGSLKAASTLSELKTRVRRAWRILCTESGDVIGYRHSAEPSALQLHAESELKAWCSDEADQASRGTAAKVEELIRIFVAQGHADFSGLTVPYVISLFEMLVAGKPLTPLTGEECEWRLVAENDEGLVTYQNIRYVHVFKKVNTNPEHYDSGDNNGSPFDRHGLVFETPNGSRFTRYENKTPITFPYSPKTITAYVNEVANDDERHIAVNRAMRAQEAAGKMFPWTVPPDSSKRR